MGFGEVGTMGQFGFFDADKRLAVISAKGAPLEMIDRVVRFESFRAEIEAVTLTPASEKKSNAGRKPIDVIVMFRMLVLQSLEATMSVITTIEQLEALYGFPNDASTVK